MKKYFALPIAAVALVSVVMTGCSGSTQTAANGTDKSNTATTTTSEQKTAYVDSHKYLTESTYHSDMDVTMTVNSTATDDQTKAMAATLSQMKIQATADADLKAKKMQMDLKASLPANQGMPSYEIPALMDYNTGKMYMRMDKFPGLATVPAVQGKLVVTDTSKDAQYDLKLYEGIDAKLFHDEQLTDEDKKAGATKKISVELDGALAQKVYAEYKGQTSGPVADTQLPTIKGGKIFALLNDKNQTIRDDIQMTMVMNNTDVNYLIKSSYSKIGEPVTFTIDPSKEPTVNLTDIGKQ